LRRIEADSLGYRKPVRKVLVAALFVLAGLACTEEQPSGRIDLTRGTYRGIGIGSSAAEVQTRLGRGESAPNGPASPLGDDFSEVGGALSIPLPHGGRVTTRDILRYDGVAFYVADDVVYGIIVTADRARTWRGLAIGDSLDEASRAYGLHCGEVSGGGEYREYPYCAGKLKPRRFVWFGEDPIRSITVSETSLLAGA
jgi:hypothetical protein